MMGAESMDATSCRQPNVLGGGLARATTSDPEPALAVYQEDPGLWITW
jgi:hypothetical protein